MSSQEIGRYQIERELGRGGMAIVYLARDPVMDRHVAVKVLPHQFTFDPQFSARFKREIQVVAALEHPRIVPVYDSGEQEGQPYIVMRYLSGGSLADKFNRGPMAITEINRIISQVAEALDEAHYQGIIHRDLKPANILFDARDYAFLSDFGIAKVAESSANLTGLGVVGTPEYMSPEQAMGDQQLDSRSDVYSLGVVLFHALTNRVPYTATTPMGTALAHIRQPLPTFSDLQINLPASYEAVVRRAMAKEPHQRYATAGELAEALQQVMASQTSSQPSSALNAEAPEPPPTLIVSPKSLDTGEAPVKPTQQPPSISLNRGSNISLSDVAPDLQYVTIAVGWQQASDNTTVDLDASAFMLGHNNQVPSDDHFVFYNNLTSPDQAVCHHGKKSPQAASSDIEIIEVDLSLVTEEIKKIVFAVTIYEAEVRGQTFGLIDRAFIRLVNRETQQELVRYNLSERLERDTAMIFGDLYRYKGSWKFRAVGQGFTGGLKGLTDTFGVDTEDDGAPLPPAAAPPTASIISSRTIWLEDKLTTVAPSILRLTKRLHLALEKADLTEHQATVALCLDVSPSMKSFYQTDKLQKFAEKILALGCYFDDRCAIDVFLFNGETRAVGPMNLDNFRKFIDRAVKSEANAGRANPFSNLWKEDRTAYSDVISFVRQFYYPDGTGQRRTEPVKAERPVYVMFVTGGGTAEEAETKQQLIWAAYEPLFWQFMAIGKSRKDIKQGGISGWFAKAFASDFTFLENLDTMHGRYVDNANFFSLEDPEIINDDELYEQLMVEYPDWVILAKAKHLLT